MGISAAIMATLAVADTAYNVYGDVKGAKGAKKTANFQAGILEQQAQDTLQIGQESANRTAAGARGLTGAQRVSEASQGVDVGSGSSADVISNDQRLSDIDITTIKNNAARDALGLRKQAQLVRMGGQQQAQSYKNAATGSLLSGATQLGSIYSRYHQTSVPRAGGGGGGGSPSSGSGGPLDPFA